MGRKRELGDAGGLNLDFNHSPTGPQQLFMDLNSELLRVWSGRGQGKTLSHPHGEKRHSGAKEPAMRWVFAEGTGEGVCGWHKDPTLVFPFLSDEAKRAQSSQANPGTAHLCVFYNGVDTIPTEPWSMCEEFPPEI